jgi:predicted transcriptional regulator
VGTRLRAPFPTAEAAVSSYAMATAKQDVRSVLDGLPEEASLEDIQYHLYVLQRIECGRGDVEAGRVLPQDEVEQRLARWLDR